MRTLKLPSKAREITRVAIAETEDYLLMIAEHGTAQRVWKLVRAYRRCQDAEELSREARQQQNRCVNYRYDDDGSLILNCRLPAEAGARIVKALELALEELPAEPPEDVPAGTSPQPVPFSARGSDALALIAESFLAHGVIEAAGGDRQQILVHVAAETVARPDRRVLRIRERGLQWPRKPRVASPATPTSLP